MRRESEKNVNEYLILFNTLLRSSFDITAVQFSMCQWVSERVFGSDVILNNEQAQPGLNVPQASNLLKNQTDLQLHAATTAQCHIFLLQSNSFNLVS